MGEPAVLNSLLATTVRSHALKFPSLPPAFFTPNPRDCKGKIRPVLLTRSPDIFENVLLEKWSFSQETSISRSQPRSLNTLIVPSSSHRRYSAPLPKSPDSEQRRHVSSSTLPPDDSKGFSAKQKETVDALIKSVPHVEDTSDAGYYDPKKAWDAFVRVEQCDAIPLISTVVLRSLADLLADDAERFYFNMDISLVFERGKQVKTILYCLNCRKNKNILSFIALKCRANCMQGKFSKARSWFGLLPKAVRESENNNLVADCLKEMILSIHHFQGIHPTIEWISSNLAFLFPFVTARKVDLGVHPRRLSVLRKAVLDVVVKMETHAVFLRHREFSWPLVRKKKFGEFLIQSLCHLRLPRGALAVLEELRDQSLVPSVFVKLQIVRFLVKEKSFELANNLYSDITRDSPPQSKSLNYLLTGLHLFSQQGDAERSREMFKLLDDQNMVTRIGVAMMLHATAIKGKVEETVEFFEQWFPPGVSMTRLQEITTILPNVIHFTEVLLAHSQRGDLEGMTKWLENMAAHDIAADEKVFTQVLSTFADRGDIDAISIVLDQMRAAGFRPTLYDYTSIISLLARRKDPVVAEATYRHAMGEGLQPDLPIILALMNAHVEGGSWKGVIRVFDYIISSNNVRLKPNIAVYNVLLKAYVLIGAPYAVVADIYLNIQNIGLRPTAYTFALLIQSACDSARMDVASDLYRRMASLAEKWQSCLHITVYVTTIIMAGYLRLGQKQKARAIFDEMKERGIAPTAVTMSVILNAYAKDGSEASWQIAEDFIRYYKPAKHSLHFDPSTGRESALQTLYSPLMNVYKENKRVEDVERLYAEAMKVEERPTLAFLTVLLDTYRRTDNIEGVHRIWPEIYELGLKYSQTHPPLASVVSTSSLPMTYYPSSILCIPLSIYIDALSAAGEHDGIANIWRAFKANNLAFDSHNWNHLTVAMIRAGEPERAFEVMERIILPYRQMSSSTLGIRDRNPESPLSFDDEEPPADDSLPAGSESGLHWGQRRVEQVQKAQLKMRRWLNPKASDEAEDSPRDFAHPLHVLQSISPSWGTWQPHTVTLSVLDKALHHLSSGLLVEPWNPVRPPRRTETEEEIEREREIAQATLQRIYVNYPNAVRAVETYIMKQTT